MKKLFLFISFLLLSTFSFADDFKFDKNIKLASVDEIKKIKEIKGYYGVDSNIVIHIDPKWIKVNQKGEPYYLWSNDGTFVDLIFFTTKNYGYFCELKKDYDYGKILVNIEYINLNNPSDRADVYGAGQIENFDISRCFINQGFITTLNVIDELKNKPFSSIWDW